MGRSHGTFVFALHILRSAVPTPAATPTDIHVVFSNHLDVGFNHRSWHDNDAPEGDAACDGLYSPDGERCLPLAANVTSEYFNVYFPRAASMSDAARKSGGDPYVYMAQPWVVALFLDCEASGVNDWRPSHGGCLRLHGTAGDDVDVEPVAGRLVVFSSQRVTHEVLPVLDGADHAARFALTLWILDPDLPLQGKT